MTDDSVDPAKNDEVSGALRKFLLDTTNIPDKRFSRLMELLVEHREAACKLKQVHNSIEQELASVRHLDPPPGLDVSEASAEALQETSALTHEDRGRPTWHENLSHEEVVAKLLHDRGGSASTRELRDAWEQLGLKTRLDTVLWMMRRDGLIESPTKGFNQLLTPRSDDPDANRPDEPPDKQAKLGTESDAD